MGRTAPVAANDRRRLYLREVLSALKGGRGGSFRGLANGGPIEAWDRSDSSWAYLIAKKIVSTGLAARRAGVYGYHYLEPIEGAVTDWHLTDDGLLYVGWPDVARRLGISQPSNESMVAVGDVPEAPPPTPELSCPPAEVPDVTAIVVKYMAALVDNTVYVRERVDQLLKRVEQLESGQAESSAILKRLL